MQTLNINLQLICDNWHVFKIHIGSPNNCQVGNIKFTLKY